MLNTDLSYVAGLFEGDGCIYIYVTPNRGIRPSLGISSVHVELLEWVKNTLNIGNIYIREKTKTNIVYSWQVSKLREVLHFSELLLPEMRLKDKIDETKLIVEYCKIRLPKIEKFHRAPYETEEWELVNKFKAKRGLKEVVIK